MTKSIKHLEEEIKLLENITNNLSSLEFPEVSVGDQVHVGLVTPGGSGMSGTVTKIEGDKIYIKNSEGKTVRGLLKNTRLLEKISESTNNQINVEFRNNQIFVEGKLVGVFNKILTNGQPVIQVTIGECSKTYGLQLPNLKKILESQVISLALSSQNILENNDPCWKNYKQIGMKKKGHREVPNCVPKESVTEDLEEMVGFHLDTERAYQAVMAKFGHAIDHSEESGVMYVPERLWPKVEQVAFDADGIGAIPLDDVESSEHYGVANQKEQHLNELDKSTLLSYIDKASKDSLTHARRAGQHGEKSLRYYDRNLNDISNRERAKAINNADRAHKRARGIVTAAGKLAR